jgi:hypothetical protein
MATQPSFLGSQNKRRIVPYTSLADCCFQGDSAFLMEVRKVFSCTGNIGVSVGLYAVQPLLMNKSTEQCVSLSVAAITFRSRRERMWVVGVISGRQTVHPNYSAHLSVCHM